MKTIRCPECNLVNWVTALDCKRCRFVFQAAESAAVETVSSSMHQTSAPQFAPQTSAPPFAVRGFADLSGAQNFEPQSEFQSRQDNSNYRPQNNYYSNNNSYQPNYRANYQPLNVKTGLAVTSMIFGILAIVMAIFLIGVVFAPIGAILGIVALVKASKKPDQYGGKGFAVAGLVMSGIVLMIVPIILAIAIPNILAAARSANEGSAVSTIRSIAKAQGNNQFNGKQLKCSSLEDLAKSKIVNEGLSDGEHNGYRFVIADMPSGGCEINATPVSTSQGTRSFYYSTAEGKIRAATKNGAVAGKNDPAIE